MTTENPINLLNETIAVSERRVKQEYDLARAEWNEHARTPFVPNPSMTVAETIAAQTAHDGRGYTLRYCYKNFQNDRRLSAILDVREYKQLLESALNYLREQSAAKQRKVEGFVSRIKDFVAPVEDIIWPVGHALPHAGPWANDATLDIAAELKIIDPEVCVFPWGESFVRIVARMNAICSAMREDAPTPAMAANPSKPFVPRPVQPQTPYAVPRLVMPPTEAPEPSRRTQVLMG